MIDWAKNEVELVCKKYTDEDVYFIECYKSALKAYNSMAGDGHSGMSWAITKNILVQLLDGKPLSPIAGTDDEWVELPWKIDGVKEWQNVRYHALFKELHEDGTIIYDDNNRFNAHIKEYPDVIFHSGIVNNELNKLYPIEFPYTPTSYLVEIEELLSDPNNGDFDTVGILQMRDKQGNITKINKFFHFKDGHHYEEISVSDYLTIKYNCNTREIK